MEISGGGAGKGISGGLGNAISTYFGLEAYRLFKEVQPSDIACKILEITLLECLNDTLPVIFNAFEQRSCVLN